MRIAYSTNAYSAWPLLSAVDRIAALGFDGVEILCDAPHLRLDRIAEPELDALAEKIDRSGLRVSNLNVNTANGFFSPLPAETLFEPSLSSVDADWRQWRLDYSLAALKAAKRLGARNISVTSGRPGSGGTPSAGVALFCESLKRLCDAAEGLGIRIGVEYEPGLLIERATELAEVMDRVDSSMLGANLDIGHSWLDGEEPEETVALLGGRIWNLHVEDIAGRKHYHLIPGEGDLPFERYFRALRSVGYEGFYTLELYTYPDTPDDAGRLSLSALRAMESRLAATE